MTAIGLSSDFGDYNIVWCPLANIGIRGIVLAHREQNTEQNDTTPDDYLYHNVMYNKPSLCGIKTESLKGYCFLYFFPPLELVIPITTYAAAVSFTYFLSELYLYALYIIYIPRASDLNSGIY